ncbi:MAG: hypothetical protein PUB10_07925 [Clostridiales bacterium]|nr:hypothetical protein [Clostridiales bacterium]
MRLHDWAVLFCGVFLVFALKQDMEHELHEAMTRRQIFYNQVLDHAVMDAAWNMVISDDGTLFEYPRKEVVKRFYDSVYLGAGVMENPYKKQELSQMIPVLIIMENDGFYTVVNEDGSGEKISYEKKYGEWKVIYQVNGLVQVEQESTGFYQMGTYEEVAPLISEPEWESFDSYEAERRKVIVDSLTNSINETMNEKNRIARKTGAVYQFRFPVIKKEEWYRTIDHPGVFAVFQGYPFALSDNRYERIAVAGARLVKQ